VTVKCRTAIKAMFLYFNMPLSVNLESFSCSYTSISFLTKSRYGELSRDDHFSPLYRLQMNLFYFKSTKGVVNVHGAWFFPNMCSNIPASPAYGVYISQLIRYSRDSSNYSDFLKRHLHLRNRLLDQGQNQSTTRKL
jgi:hypothetical protein